MKVSNELKGYVKYEETLCPWYRGTNEKVYFEMVKVFGKGTYTITLDDKNYLISHRNGDLMKNDPPTIDIKDLSKLKSFKIN